MALGAIKQGIDGWRQFMREEAKATRVARATSLEVQPGEGMTEARRRLAEEPVCLPASSFALKIGATRRRRALAAIDLDAVEAAKIKSFANGDPPVTVTAEQMALEDLGDSTVRVTIVQAEGGPTAQDITAAATLPAFLAIMCNPASRPSGCFNISGAGPNGARDARVCRSRRGGSDRSAYTPMLYSAPAQCVLATRSQA